MLIQIRFSQKKYMEMIKFGFINTYNQIPQMSQIPQISDNVNLIIIQQSKLYPSWITVCYTSAKGKLNYVTNNL